MPRVFRRRPLFEPLEGRLTPATFGIPWPDPGHLTLSFAPDGTDVGGAPSTLAQTLGARLATSAWETDLLRAFQTWAVDGNINIGLVPDDGAPLGQAGPPQGAPGVGDIRIAARPLSPDAVALATPFDLLNSGSGDVILNSDDSFGGAGTGGYDLFSVALHEAGHVLGLPDSTDPNSPMDSNYLGNTAPTPADIAALQALYGTRAPDPFEGPTGNNTFATATPLPVGAIVNADVGTGGDVDIYKVAVPDGAPGLAVAVRTSGISLLTPRVTVYDAAQQVVATASSTDPLNGDLSLSLGQLPAGTYYVKVEGSQANVFGVGSYRLAVGPDATAALAGGATGGLPGGWQGNHSFARAVVLPSANPVTDPTGDVAVTATLTTPSQGDFFRFRTPHNAPRTMLVTVWATAGSALSPKVTVFDADRVPVLARVVAQDQRSETIQVTGAARGATYFARVAPADPNSPSTSTGGYALAVDYPPAPVHPDTLAAGTLRGSHDQEFGLLSVPNAELLHLNLSAGAEGSKAGVSVRVTLSGADGRPVATLTASPGTPASADVLLGAGRYAVSVAARTATGAPLPATSYQLLGLTRSDPIGPILLDPTLAPTAPAPTPPTGPDPSGPVYIPIPSPFYFNFLGLIALAGNPWSS